MRFFKGTSTGLGHLILNIFRAINIIALVSTVVASFVMLVKTFIVQKFYLFDAVSHLVVAFLSILLIITETPLLRGYISRNWPLLSPSSGFVTLGLTMLVLGSLTLGNLNKKATSEKSLGKSMWQVVISSGIITLVMGFVNIFATYIFRDHSGPVRVSARQVRSEGSLSRGKVLNKATTTPSVATSGSQYTTPRRSFHLGRSDSLPSYNRPNPPVQNRNVSAPMTQQTPREMEQGDWKIGERPPTAMHPAYMQGRPF